MKIPARQAHQVRRFDVLSCFESPPNICSCCYSTPSKHMVQARHPVVKHNCHLPWHRFSSSNR